MVLAFTTVSYRDSARDSYRISIGSTSMGARGALRICYFPLSTVERQMLLRMAGNIYDDERYC